MLVSLALLLLLSLSTCANPNPHTPAQVNELEPEPWLGSWQTIFLTVPREVDQVNYSQTIEKIAVTCNASPSGIADFTDEYGNNYKVVYWNAEQTDEIIASLETTILRKLVMTPVTTSDPYPILEDSLPDDVKLYLNPTPLTQSDDPRIIFLAQALSQGFSKEIDVINNTIEWVEQNIKFKCSRIIEEEYGFLWSDAVNTLKYHVGICGEIARLMIALFKAQGIPARYVFEFQGYEHDNPGFLKPVETNTGHACVEVYFPEVGWVRYDLPYLPPVYVPFGIPILVSLDGLGGYGVAKGDFEEKWQAIGSGTSKNNRVNLTYTVTVVKKKQSLSQKARWITTLVEVPLGLTKERIFVVIVDSLGRRTIDEGERELGEKIKIMSRVVGKGEIRIYIGGELVKTVEVENRA